jgi:tRNA (guanine26-N2/guanine27-N2)-dimethyltransferase
VDDNPIAVRVGGLKCFTGDRRHVSPELVTTVEGSTRLLVPYTSLKLKAPETHPVFFNPAARLNRDVSVAVASVTGPSKFLDSLASTGARGLRVAKEADDRVEVTLVDFNRESLAIAMKNARTNGLEGRCEVLHSEANRYLFSRFERDEKFDAVDVDPFGSPAPYLQAALVASGDGAMLSFTATDAPVLCGVYPEVAQRRYGASAPRSEFVHETAVRILAGFAVRMGGINDIGVSPVMAHSTLHYFRVYARVTRGAAAADEAQRALGYVTQCNSCQSRSSGDSPIQRCPDCGKKVKSAGPLWAGSLGDEKLLRASDEFCSKRGWGDSAATISSLLGVDSLPPFSYSVERSASRVGVPSVPLDALLETLSAMGFRSAKQPFEGLSVKTDTSVKEFDDAVRGTSHALAQTD